MISILAATVMLQSPNTLTAAEKRGGWKLLFDGKSMNGWTNYKSDMVGPGWEVANGEMTSIMPEAAGDIVTKEQFDWFELKVDFKLTKGGNSGVMFHVTEAEKTVWQTGPEVQIYDAPKGVKAEVTGWLYQLYPSSVDATKPVGEWNTMHLVISPSRCETRINGVKYYDFVLDSADFKARLAKTKFAQYKGFAAARKGMIAIQGDHGVVSFRNIKLKPIKVK